MQPIRRWQTASAVPHAPGTNRFELPVRLSPRPRRARHSVSAGVAKGGRAASAGRQLRTKSLRERVRKKLREVPLTCLEQGGGSLVQAKPTRRNRTLGHQRSLALVAALRHCFGCSALLVWLRLWRDRADVVACLRAKARTERPCANIVFLLPATWRD